MTSKISSRKSVNISQETIIPYATSIPDIPDLVLSPESPLQIWWKRYLDSMGAVVPNTTKKHRVFTFSNDIIVMDTNYHVYGVLPQKLLGGGRFSVNRLSTTRHGMVEYNDINQEHESLLILNYFLQEYLKIEKKSCKGHPDIIIKTLCELYEGESAIYIEALNDENHLREEQFELPQVSDEINFERPFFGMIYVLIKSASWMHNRLLMIQYGIFGMFFEVIHSANDRIRHTKNIKHILQILKEITVPHFILLAEFLGVPIGDFKQQFKAVSTSISSNWDIEDPANDTRTSSDNIHHTFRFSNTGIKTHPPVTYHEYDRMILSHLDYVYNITNLVIESLQVTTEILENNPSVSFLFSLQELILHLVRKILSVYRNEDIDKFIKAGGHKVLLYSLSWPLEHKQLVTSTEGGWQNLDFYLLDQKRMTKYYDLRTLALQSICDGILYNPGFLEKLTDIGFFEYMVHMGLWLTYFFSLDVTGDHETRIQTWKENLSTYNIWDSIETSSSENGVSEKDLMEFITVSETYNPQDSPILSPGFTKKLVNKKLLNVFNMISSLANKIKSFEATPDPIGSTSDIPPSPEEISLHHWNRNKQRLPLIFLDIFSDENVGIESLFYLDARKKMKLYSDFQLYFLDQIVLYYSSYRNGLDLFIENGLYEVFFSEYFYFFGGQSNIVNKCTNIQEKINSLLVQGPSNPTPPTNCDTPVESISHTSEKVLDPKMEEMSEVTADSLRLCVLQILKCVATTVDKPDSTESKNISLLTNKRECRMLLSIFASHSSNPFVVTEVGKAFLEIIDHRYECTQKVLQELNAFSIASFALQEQLNLQKLIESYMEERTNPIIEGLSNIELLHKVQEARNIILRLISVFFTFETNLRLMVDDDNTLNSLFYCLFIPKLRAYGLEHLKKLTNMEVEDAAAFSSLVNAYMTTMKKIVDSPSVDAVHLLMITLKMLQSSLATSPKFTEQFRNYFTDLLSLLNLNPESILDSGMSGKEFIFLMLKNLNLILYSTTQRFVELETKLRCTFPLMTNHLFGISHSVPQEDLNGMKTSPQILHDLLDLMVDGKFSIENRFIIRNAFVLPLMFPIAMKFDEKVFTSFIQDFIHITKKSPRNRDLCCQVGLLGTVLEMIEEVEALFDTNKSFNRISDYVVSLLEILGKHSINVKELKSFFHLLKRQSENVTSPLLNMLFRCLQGMTNYSPSTYFSFDMPRSGLTFTRFERFPSTGYTISAWVRLLSLDDVEDKSSINEQTQHRYFFCSTTERGKPNLELYFQRDGTHNRLHINSKKDVIFNYHFEEGKWYHIAITHSKGVYIFSKPEARLFINGIQQERIYIKYPGQTQSVCASIAHRHAQSVTSKNTQPITALFGNIGAFHFFEDVLGPNQIVQIFALGPQYLSYFDPSDSVHFLAQKSSVFDGSLQNKLLLAVNARAHIGGVCINIAHPRNLAAYIQKDTQLCASQNAKDIIGCLGGMKVLFPLFFRIDKLSHSELSADSLDPYLVNSIILLVLDMLKNHKENIDDMIRWKGFQVIGYLLKLISPQHRTQQTVKLIPTLISTVADSPELMDQVVKYILFDFKIWIHTQQEIQLALLDRLILESTTSKFQQQAYFRKLGVRYIMDMMRMFYWVELEDVSLGEGQICNPSTNQVLGERPWPQGIVEIRQKVIILLKTIMQGAPTLEEIEVIIRFLTDSSDSIQLRDILQFLLELIMNGDSTTAIIDLVIQAGGFEVLTSLLSKPNEDIVELSIKCIGQILLTSSKVRQKYNMDQSYGFSYLKVLISTSSFTEKEYRALRNLALGKVTMNDRENDIETNDDVLARKSRKNLSTSETSLPIACVFISIFELLQMAAPDLLLGLLKDLKSKVELPYVQAAILKQERWQYYLLSLMGTVATNIAFSIQERISIHRCVMDIIARCLFYALKNVKQGFKCVEETCAYLFFLAEDRILSYRDVLGGIYDRILNIFVDGVKNLEMQYIRVNDSSLFDNFLHFTSLIEELLFHTNGINQSLFGKWKKKKKHFSLSLGARTPTNEGEDEEPIQGTQRKLSNGVPFAPLPIEEELNLGEGNIWKDSAIAGKLLNLLFHWELLSIASFTSQYKNVTAQKNLREGGILRIALRLIKHLMLYNTKIKSAHLKYLEQIVKMDKELEKEFQQLSELWVVTGELKKTDDYHDRVMFILQFLCDAYDRMVEIENTEDATKVLNCIRAIFMLRKSMLEKTLKDHVDTPLVSNPNKFIFFLKRPITIQDYDYIRQGKIWRFVREKYFLEAAKKVVRQEEDFIQSLIRRYKSLLNQISKKNSTYEEAVDKAMCAHQEEIKRVIEPLRQKEYNHIRNEKAKYEEEERINAILWIEIMRDVSNERGAWGNQSLPSDTRWIMDKTENKHRMRLKLKRDYRDITHEGAAMSNYDPATMPSLGDVELNESKTKSKTNEITSIPRLAIRKEQGDENENDVLEDDAEKDTSGINDVDEITIDTGANGLVQEKTIMKVSCEVVTPMQGFSGTFELTTKRILITIDKENKADTTSDSVKTKHLQKVPTDKIIPLENIKELHPRRYQLLQTALELFFTNHKNLMINFKKDDRNRIFKKIVALKPPNLIRITKIRTPLENFARTGLTKLWQKRQISNFDYLMELNTYANRTYNDLSQYPIFPWVLVDYTSPTIDLSDLNVYRDLSKPIGALNPDRLEEIDMRYNMIDDPTMEKFHYGSHYSSPGVVLYYLVRMEPFTTYLRILQGGKFDHADRMFDSIPQTWINTQQSSDFKELVPEFFYNPNFLTMTNKLNLGYKASGRQLGNAILPTWAKDANEFITINRRALESDYVSQHLHEWIDLIFGYKQRGPEAIKARNVFFYLTYEGKVDFENIDNEIDRRSIISQIQNFGQTPSQLFKKSHPVRDSVEPLPVSLSQKVENVTCKELKCNSIVYLSAMPSQEKLICITSEAQVIMLKFSFPTAQMGEVLKKGTIEFPFSHDTIITRSCFAYSSTLKDAVFSCGHWDFSLRCTRPFTLQNATSGHWRQRDVITCVTLSENDEYLVSGSKDTTVMTWSIDKNGNIAPQPDNILYGHDDEVTCVAVSDDLDVIVSGGKDGTMIVHTLRSGKYTRTIPHPSHYAISSLAIDGNTGRIVMHSEIDNMLYLFSINGQLLRTANATQDKLKRSNRYGRQIYQLIIQGDRIYHDGCGENIYCRNLEDLSLIHIVNTPPSVRSFTIVDGFAFIGLVSGNIIVKSGPLFRYTFNFNAR